MEQLNDLLNSSLNQKVISSRTGGGAGAIWLIKFENNTNIMIWCTWRMERENLVLATSTDDSTAITGRMAVATNLLEKEQVKLLSYELSEQYDLILHFEKGYCARIFCDVSYSQTEDGGDGLDVNWEYSNVNTNTNVTVSNEYKLIFQNYN